MLYADTVVLVDLVYECDETVGILYNLHGVCEADVEGQGISKSAEVLRNQI